MTVAEFKPLSDQILVKPLPFEEMERGIVIPQTAEHGRLPIRRGIVMKIGCGDLVAPKCWVCDGSGSVMVEVDNTGCAESWGCDECDGTGFLPHERTTFECAPGDEILFHPRGWAEPVLDGEKYIVLHEDQGVLGILAAHVGFQPVAPESIGGRSPK